ncbi:MAG: siroheme synthase [Erythrobacter sp.]|nr:siroheme synthase [Erythrobacter sp.]
MAGITSLPLFHRVRGGRVVVIGEGEAAVAKRRLVERAGGIPCSEAEAHHAAIAFVALQDPRAAEVAARRIKRRGMLVNVVDRPDLCDFTTPSILDRDPLLIAIGTGGASAGLAKHLRLRLEAILPQSLGKLARALFDAREALRKRFPDAADQRRALDTALQAGGTLDPLREDAAERVPGWLESADAASVTGRHAFTIASEDPDDLTVRQARLLGQADVILHDSTIAPAILARARADAVRHVLPYDGPSEGLVIELVRG